MSKAKIAILKSSPATQFNRRDFGATLIGVSAGILLGYSMFNDTHRSFFYVLMIVVAVSQVGNYFFKSRGR
jgi:hypothetical protein